MHDTTTNAAATHPDLRRWVGDMPTGAIDTVLLDVGGVLVADYWETILLTPGDGLADRFGLDARQVLDVGLGLWERHCRTPTVEADYWAALADALDIDIPAELPSELDALVNAGAGAGALLDDLTDAGFRLGVISNNTAFWFAKQSVLVDLDRHVERDIVFCSHDHGRTKGDEPSLFDSAALAVNPATTLVLDDRAGNVDGAHRRGFHAHQLLLAPGPDLP